MTYILSVDPGLNTGVAYGFYDGTTPFQLLGRWQVHGGLDGFIEWWRAAPSDVDECIVEKFVSVRNDFAPDISGVPIEGVLAYVASIEGFEIIEHTRADKSGLVGYPKEATTKVARQRVRFDFLERHGLFISGTENDDTHDAICHILVSLKRRRHAPTIRAFWPPKRGDDS